ncbi:MAG TPA: hypothetical protein K8V48_01505 [Limosilactobacillus oris]|uniref:hypothetical protein n=1 Tax=Limosilactobacillus oris TaxID=1632 RepID=UPI001D604241|nr:hypothetical protein [Limosilactobacillus oris]HJF46664.1 hypothetical protein [Limosilactobacillus oris]
MAISNKNKTKYQKLAVVKLSMADREIIWSDEDAYIGMQNDKVFLAKEYKLTTDGTLKYDGNTLINPIHCVCARPMMKLVKMTGDDK